MANELQIPNGIDLEGGMILNAKNIASNIVIVKSLSDFPTPIAGVITLVNNTTYQINGTVSIGTNRIVLGISNVILGVDKSDDKLVYTGAAAMITGVNQSFSMRYLTVVANTAGATVFDLTGTSATNYEIQEIIFAQCKSLGTVNGFNVFVFSKNFITASDNGISFGAVSSNQLILIDNLFSLNNNTVGCKFINITTGGAFNDIVISRSHFGTLANESAIVVGAITVTNYGKVLANTFFTTGTPLTGINYQSVGWRFDSNSNVLNTAPNGQLNFNNNASTISLNNSFAATGGTFSLLAGASKFDMPSNGRLRYIGKENATLRIIATLNAFGASAFTAEAIIMKNGVAQTNSKMGWTVYTASEPVTVQFLDNNAVQNDYYEVFIKKVVAGVVTTTVVNCIISSFRL